LALGGLDLLLGQAEAIVSFLLLRQQVVVVVVLIVILALKVCRVVPAVAAVVTRQDLLAAVALQIKDLLAGQVATAPVLAAAVAVQARPAKTRLQMVLDTAETGAMVLHPQLLAPLLQEPVVAVVLVPLKDQVDQAVAATVDLVGPVWDQMEHSIPAAGPAVVLAKMAAAAAPVSSSSHTLHKNINTSKTIRKCQRYKLIILLIRMIMEPQVFLLV
jgi:hypothetical protein